MTLYYDHKFIEKKWKKKWKKNKINIYNNKKPKYYCLDMFPYPSGNGLHIGHWRGYVISDVISRYKIMKGYFLIHPIGWDAFGLPAENCAIKMGVHPLKLVKANIKNIKRQIKDISAIYDWNMEINTTDPKFYKWTQWIFIQMFKKKIAYEKKIPINWCPSCKTGLANEEVINGYCERCCSKVIKKNVRQWMLNIRKYANRLLNDLNKLNWPQKIKKMQSDWIGKTNGIKINFKIYNKHLKIKVYTTKPEVIYGVVAIIISLEHKFIKLITTKIIRKYLKHIFINLNTNKKFGLFTGCYAINPINNIKIPIWISNYVQINYGTDSIMCVPAHNDNDFEFAKKFNISIIQVISKDGKENKKLVKAYIKDGIIINSNKWNGMKSILFKKRILDILEKMNIGKKTINYKLHDWIFSRQRYWGEPIPIIHCKICGNVPVPYNQLPLILPNVKKYKPTNTGKSPLSNIHKWVNTICPICRKHAKRETNTMPQWAGSSWYFLRYIDNNNNDKLVSKKKVNKYLPVDIYIGGIEHAILHLLYSRFYTKFLYDINIINFDEPFKKVFNQGMIIGNNGIKMSKSKGNIVSPDILIKKYGCDTLRIYILFIGPPKLNIIWNNYGINGVYKFIKRFWLLSIKNINKSISENKETIKLRNELIIEITKRFKTLSFNTIVSKFMEYNNKLIKLFKKKHGIDKKTIEIFIKLLSPLAPHLSEELWEKFGHNNSVFNEKWPIVDENFIYNNKIKILIQINGKMKYVINVNKQISNKKIITIARKIIKNRFIGIVIKEIYIIKKIMNIIIRK